jgi:hypothetical protein
MAHTRLGKRPVATVRRFREGLPVRGYYGDVGVGKSVVLARICDLHICVTSIEERNSPVSVRDPSPVRSAMARSGARARSGVWVFFWGVWVCPLPWVPGRSAGQVRGGSLNRGSDRRPAPGKRKSGRQSVLFVADFLL